MFKLFHKKLNKKGFTLAELLIVVAIIAVLVAIAIPIFMNSLAKAEKAAADANVRSVKAAAINTILEQWDMAPGYFGYTDGATMKNPAKEWNVHAVVEDGDITKCTIDAHSEGKGDYKTPQVKKEENTTKDGYKYTIDMTIKDVQVTKTPGA